MQTRPLTKADYAKIVSVIDHWWEGPTSALAHPMFFYELGRLARVVEAEHEMVGFLFGFVAPEAQPFRSLGAAEPEQIGYVHLVGIHPDFRRRGVARVLYAAFEDDCRAASCVALKAITTHGNSGSVRFHLALGWSATEVDDYAGPGRSRIVFEKRL